MNLYRVLVNASGCGCITFLASAHPWWNPLLWWEHPWGRFPDPCDRVIYRNCVWQRGSAGLAWAQKYGQCFVFPHLQRFDRNCHVEKLCLFQLDSESKIYVMGDQQLTHRPPGCHNLDQW